MGSRALAGKRSGFAFDWRPEWTLSFAALMLYAAVYRWDYIELRIARFSLVLVLIAVVACGFGIWQSSRDQGRKVIGSARARRLLIAVVLVMLFIHVRSAVRTVRHHPGNVIDVFIFQTDGVDALLHGIDPYTTTHANIYGPSETARFYPPGLVVDSRVHLGFPYPPLTLLFAIPGYLLRDVRYAHIAAIAVSALFLVGMRKTWLSAAAMAVFLFNPLTFLIERYSWTDSFVVLALSATIYAGVKRKWWLPIAMGLFFASKQYAVLGAPFVLLLADFDWKRSLKLLAQAIGVAAVITLPFVIWNFHGFVHDTIVFFIQCAPRADSLSFAARHAVPFWAVMLLVGGGTLWTLKITRREPAMFAACFGFVFLLFVCVNKQAFANYYFLAAQSLWLAVAGLGDGEPARGGAET